MILKNPKEQNEAECVYCTNKNFTENTSNNEY